MALTKPTPQDGAAATPTTAGPATVAAAAVKSAGSFESIDETTAGTEAANEPAAEAAAPAVTPAASVPAVAAPAGAVVVSTRAEASAFQKEVEAMKGAADFSYGNYPVFKGNNGEIMQTGGDKLGRWVKVSMIAWDDHTEVSPGSKSEKSKEAVAYSNDGIVIDSVIGKDEYGSWVGKKVTDYVEFLKNDGDYPEASASRFVDIACVVHESDSEDKFNGEIIQITLTKSSIPSFQSYQEQLVGKAKAVARGIPGVKLPADPFTFYFLRDVTTKGDNTWTKLKVVSVLPAKL